jgi:hypothetical protein
MNLSTPEGPRDIWPTSFVREILSRNHGTAYLAAPQPTAGPFAGTFGETSLFVSLAPKHAVDS